MKDIIALCNRDKEDYGIENDQFNTCNDYVCVHNQKRVSVCQRAQKETKKI